MIVKKTKQLVSLILVIAMICSLIPCNTSYAAEVPEESTEDLTEEETEEEGIETTTEITTEITTEDSTESNNSVNELEETSESSTEGIEAPTEITTETQENSTEDSNKIQESTTEALTEELSIQEDSKEEELENVNEESYIVFDHLFADIDVSCVNTSSLFVETNDSSVFTKNTNVDSNYENVYIISFNSIEEARYAYSYYYDKVSFITDLSNTVSLCDATSTDASEDIADLSTVNCGSTDAISNISNKSIGNYSGYIALIDSGANADVNLSVTNSGTGDSTGHGTKMLNYIKEENPNAKVVSIKAFDGYSSNVADVYAAIKLAIEGNVSVINLSFVSINNEYNEIISDIIQEALNKGITVIGAAGNYSSNAQNYLPGAIAGVISVGAVNEDGSLYKTSNYNADLYVVAKSTSEATARYSGIYTSGNDSEKVYKKLHNKSADEEKEDALSDNEVRLQSGYNESRAAAWWNGADKTTFPQVMTANITLRGNTGAPTTIADLKVQVAGPDGWSTLVPGYIWAETWYVSTATLKNYFIDAVNSGAIFKGNFTPAEFSNTSNMSNETVWWSCIDQGNSYPTIKDENSDGVVTKQIGWVKLYDEIRDVDGEKREYAYYGAIWDSPQGTQSIGFIIGFYKTLAWRRGISVKKVNESGNIVSGCDIDVYTSDGSTKIGDMVENAGTYTWTSGEMTTDQYQKVSIKEITGGGDYNNYLNNGKFIHSDGSLQTTAEAFDTDWAYINSTITYTQHSAVQKRPYYVSIKKKDGSNNQNLDSCSFKIYSGDTTIATGVSRASDGMVVDSSGNYYWDVTTYVNSGKKIYAVETAAKSGYTLNNKAVELIPTQTSNPSIDMLDSPSITAFNWKTEMYITKSVSDSTCIQNNPNYSLEGTTFEVYKKNAATGNKETVGTLVVGPNNTTNVLNLSSKMDKSSNGNPRATVFYYVETKAGKGMKDQEVKDGTEHNILIQPGTIQNISVTNAPRLDPVRIELTKSDASGAVGNMSDAEFTIKYYALDASASTTYTKEQLAAINATRTWVIKTIYDSSKKSYIAVLDQTHKVSGGDFYYLNGKQNIPLGWLTIQETKAPIGYNLDNEVSVLKIDESHSDLGTINVVNSSIMNSNGSGSVYEKQIRADFELTKVDYDNGEPMGNVLFKITNTDTKESHEFTTDRNGHYSSADIKHSDEGGIWFKYNKDNGESPVDDTVGALPYGNYSVEELRCEANKGKQLEPIKYFTVSSADDSKVIKVYDVAATTSEEKLHNVNDAYLQTQAFCIETQSHTLANDPFQELPQTIEDKVWYWYLGSNEDFTMVGKLMVKEADGTFHPYKKVALNTATGRYEESTDDLVEYLNFTTESEYHKSYYEQCGEKIMTFNDVVPLKKDEGKSYVVFEYLYKGTWDETNIDQAGEPYIKHEEDIYEQTIFVPRGETTAYNVSNLSNTSFAKTVNITDIVGFSGLTPGKPYDLKTRIYVREDKNINGIEINSRAELEGHLLKDSDGNIREFTTTFTPTEPNGKASITVTLDLSEYFDKSFVFLEDVYDEGLLIFSHCDVNSTPQTIHVPKISTRAFGEGDIKIVYAKNPTTTFKDEIGYLNLESDSIYTAVGYILDAKTGKEVLVNGKRIQATKTFTTPAANRENGGVDGTVYVDFSVVNAKKVLEGIDIVIYEEIYVGTTTTPENLISEHKDLTDKEQKLKFIKIGTMAKNGESDDGDQEKLLKPDGSYKVIDTVSLTNIELNNEFKLEGVLMRKDTGEELKDKNGNSIRSNAIFTPNESTGSIDVTFAFETDETDIDVVVYEELYIKHNDKWLMIEDHKDIDSEDQTVKIGSKGKMSLDKKPNEDNKKGKTPGTGDSLPIISVIIIMVLSLVGITVSLKKKRKDR